MRLADVHQAVAAAYGRDLTMAAAGRAERGAAAPSAKDLAADAPASSSATQAQALGKLTSGLQSFMQTLGVDLNFTVTDAGEVQVEVLRQDGERVIRKVPSDEMLALAQSIRAMSGAFLNKDL